LLQLGQITPQLALKVLLQFDKSINSALSQRVRNRVCFKVCCFQVLLDYSVWTTSVHSWISIYWSWL